MRTPTKESDEITIEEIVIDSIIDKIDEVVAGGSSIRLLIRVPGRLEKDQSSSRLLRG